jgi:hypothetical protein
VPEVLSIVTTTGPVPVFSVTTAMISLPFTPTTSRGMPLIETFTWEVSEEKLLPLISTSVPMGPVAGEKEVIATGWEELWENPLLFLQLMQAALMTNAINKTPFFIFVSIIDLILN